MKSFIKLSGILIALSCPLMMEAQDIHYSQFYDMSIIRNPGLVGIFSGDYKVTANYRNQWSSVSKPFQTMTLNAETRFNVNEVGDFLSVGLATAFDRAGSAGYNRLHIMPAVNYNKNLEDSRNSYLSVGFVGGFNQHSVDPAKMTFASQYINGAYNPVNPTGESITQIQRNYLDIGAGVSFNSSLGSENQATYYLGLAAYHLNRPKIAFGENEHYLRLKPRWSGQLGFRYSIDPTISVTFHSQYSLQGDYRSLILGGLFSFSSVNNSDRLLFTVHGGVFYRYQDAIIPTIKIDYMNYSFAFSYDRNISQLRTASMGNGGFEISCILKGFFNSSLFKDNQFKCPRFEQTQFIERLR